MEPYKNTFTLVRRKLGGFGLLLSRKTGVVSYIVKGGEAESAGVEVGDLITSLNAEKDREFSSRELADALSRVPVGKSVMIKSQRKQDAYLSSQERKSGTGNGSKMQAAAEGQKNAQQNGREAKNSMQKVNAND